MLLGCVRPGAGALRATLCALSLGLTLLHGVVHYRTSVRWDASWPRWPDQVRAWEANPQHPLEIWPPPWTLSLPVPVTRRSDDVL